MTDYLANNGKPWLSEDLEALGKIYAETDNATLGRIFRRSEASIQNQAINTAGVNQLSIWRALSPGVLSLA